MICFNKNLIKSSKCGCKVKECRILNIKLFVNIGEETSKDSYYPLRLLIPALMISSTRRRLLAITEHELSICFFTI